ncbi:MAG: phosphoribosylpyrophosphate synthetase [Candidatus Omnitrophica bacterium 4484_213]|nr:MAG: phosphoribosylpyrophosphate synthetase [Candidatus Omnitrophica bacterium 4484_213]
MDKLAIFTGNANRRLAEGICAYLKVSLKDALVSRFSEGEIQVKINENVRGLDVFVIQSVSPPPNENLMELLVLIDALKRASAKRITAVLPYYAYARQDRKDQPRVPITAKLVANLITVAGADRLLTMDLHAGQIQGFFDIPVDHLFAAPVFIEYLKQLGLSDGVVVSPDVGGIKMARAFAKRLGVSLAIVDKRRINATDTEVMNVIGEVFDKDVIIVDDMVATAGSLKEAVLILKKKGARDIYAAISHPVLSGAAIERIKSIPLKQLIVSDTILIPPEKRLENIKILSIANLLGEAIKRIHQEESVSSLFV